MRTPGRSLRDGAHPPRRRVAPARRRYIAPSAAAKPARLAAALLLSVAVLQSVLPEANHSARAEDWPCWRGPRGDGSSLRAHLPTRWDGPSGAAIRWRTPLEGAGYASPIVWRDRIYTVSCLEDREERVLVCLDRRDGRTLWQQVVLRSPLEGKHPKNSFASSTPATDGERVVVAFLDRHEIVVAAYDLDGQRQWVTRPGEFYSKHGFCSCPVLFEDLVIVNGDHDGESYLVALDRATGSLRWKSPREGRTRSYSTPIIREIDGRTQMLLSGSHSVASYDPRTGAQHWVYAGPTEQFVASVVYSHGLVLLTAGFPEHHILALRPDGRGPVADEHVVWHETRGAAYVPSPVAVGDYFLLVSDGGIASCFEIASGRRLWMERLGTAFSASAITAGGLVYFTDERGTTTVVRPGPALDVVARNDLGEAVFASPAVGGYDLLLRGERHLFSIASELELP